MAKLYLCSTKFRLFVYIFSCLFTFSAVCLHVQLFIYLFSCLFTFLAVYLHCQLFIYMFSCLFTFFVIYILFANFLTIFLNLSQCATDKALLILNCLSWRPNFWSKWRNSVWQLLWRTKKNKKSSTFLLRLWFVT